MVLRPDIHAEPAVGDGGAFDHLGLRARLGLGRDEMIDRQDEFRSGELQDMSGHVKLVGLNLALADRVALGLEKRVGHGAADQELVNFLEQALDDQDLVGNLGSAHDGQIGALGMAQERVEDLAVPSRPESRWPVCRRETVRAPQPWKPRRGGTYRRRH